MSTRVAARWAVTAVGLFFVVLAIAGFASISDETTVGGNLRGGNEADLLWGLFSVNTVLNFIHLLFGALTIVAGTVVTRTRMLVWTMAGAFAAVLIYDIVSLSVRTGTDPLAINQADVWLHAIAAVVLAVLAITAAKAAHPHRPVRTASAPTASRPSPG
ncbi:hypothetical protein ALI144C_36965 [Actinosynnema sp. ALI-1.44]|uniref:DUF4383 domain-containing protein n=1 Tax=Actinosynnema sp. ALI-1.44 TaxID=1933779 RepID=UPI00097BED45|nr:DUF4383 domain-containing protein [Actinosynnema sp. ALI-1.44]ONI76256.1 hypothetical protein ALI144C_36965 [Actinosynnema sp. ALI-1.44]